jgi:hypothetical protein
MPYFGTVSAAGAAALTTQSADGATAKSAKPKLVAIFSAEETG